MGLGSPDPRRGDAQGRVTSSCSVARIPPNDRACSSTLGEFQTLGYPRSCRCSRCRVTRRRWTSCSPRTSPRERDREQSRRTDVWPTSRRTPCRRVWSRGRQHVAAPGYKRVSISPASRMRSRRTDVQPHRLDHRERQQSITRRKLPDIDKTNQAARSRSASNLLRVHADALELEDRTVKTVRNRSP